MRQDRNRKKIRIKKIVISIFFLIGCFLSENHVQANEVIRVAFPLQEHFSEINENGEYTGYNYEYLQKLAQFTGWKYEIVTVEGTLDEQLKIFLDMLEKGEVDLLGVMSKNKMNEDKFCLTQRPYGVVYGTLSVPANSTRITDANFDVIAKEGVTIAAWEKSGKLIRELENYMKNNGFIYTIETYSTMGDAQKAVDNGEADLFLSNDTVKRGGSREVADFAGSPYYFAVNKKDIQLAKKIDWAIQQEEVTDPYYKQLLYQKYFSAGGNRFWVRENERIWIKEQDPLRVLVDIQTAPFQYKEGEGYGGISVSVLKDFAEVTGYEIEYVEYKSDMTTMKDLERQEIDLILGATYDIEDANAAGYLVTLPYISTDMVIYSKKKVDIKELDNQILALPHGMIPLRGYQVEKVKYYENFKECVQAVDRGEADFGYASAYAVNYYFSQNVYPNIMIIQLPGVHREYCFGVVDYRNTTLMLLLNRFITTKDDDLTYGYLANEISKSQGENSISEYIKRYPGKAVTMIALASVLICGIVIFYLKLKQKQELLMAENNAKTRFLSNMSHEMRTPLGAILGLSSIQMKLLQEQNIEKAADCATKITLSAEHMLELVNDVLDISKINESKMRLVYRTLNISQLLEEIRTVYEVKALENEVVLKVFYPSNLPLVEGDGLKIKQILINLVSNAIKYNRNGGKVIVEVESKREEEETITLQFSVRDDGHGIENDNLSRIFEAFEREERMEEREGTGLGLVISRSYLRLMDSDFAVESTVNQGSNFCFILCLNKVAKEEACKQENYPSVDMLSGKRILVAEDNKINQMIIQSLLDSQGAEVTMVENGKEAIEVFERSTHGTFQAILMDIRMPVLDGIKAARRIRELSHPDGSCIPIIALSANAYEVDREMSRAAGMNEHLAKPIEREQFFATLYKLTK